MNELRIAKIAKVFDKNIITEINLELQEFSKVTKDTEIDKHAIEYLIDQCKKDIQEEVLKRQQQEILKRLQEEALKRFRVRGSRLSNVSFNETEYDNFMNLPYNTEHCGIKDFFSGLKDIFSIKPIPTNPTKLITGLTKLSDSLIAMNANLKFFDKLINADIEKVKSNFITTYLNKSENTETQVNSLIKIIEKAQLFYENIQRVTFQNESMAVILVIKINPRFLINQ